MSIAPGFHFQEFLFLDLVFTQADQLDAGHGAGVIETTAEAQDAGVTTGAFGESRADGG